MRGTPRKSYAVLAMLLWLLGVEVLPNLHLATHAHDHTHTPAGTIVVVTFDEDVHRHDDGSVHAHAADAAAHEDHDRPRDKRQQLAFDEVLPGHTADGLAHRAIALQDPPPPVAAPVEVPRSAWWIATTPAAVPETLVAARPVARGPPVA